MGLKSWCWGLRKFSFPGFHDQTRLRKLVDTKTILVVSGLVNDLILHLWRNLIKRQMLVHGRM